MATSFTDRHNDEGTEAKVLDLPLFDLGTVADATGSFSIENKLGEGGFGPVYKVGNRPSLAVYSFTNLAALNQKLAGQAGGRARDCCEEAVQDIGAGHR